MVNNDLESVDYRTKASVLDDECEENDMEGSENKEE